VGKSTLWGWERSKSAQCQCQIVAEQFQVEPVAAIRFIAQRLWREHGELPEAPGLRACADARLDQGPLRLFHQFERGEPVEKCEGTFAHQLRQRALLTVFALQGQRYVLYCRFQPAAFRPTYRVQVHQRTQRLQTSIGMNAIDAL